MSALRPLRLRWLMIPGLLAVVGMLAGAALNSYFVAMSVLSAASADSAVTFFVLGDHGAGTLKQKFVARWLEQSCRNSRNANFVLLLGDNFYPRGVTSVEDEKWRTVFEEVYDSACLSEIPFYASLGNHDHQGSVEAQIEYGRSGLGSGRWRMPASHYVQDFQGGETWIRLVVLDTERFRQDEHVEGQLALLDEAFSGADPAMWRLVAGHVPVRSFSARYGDSRMLMEKLLPKLQEHDVDVYLSGHAHNLQMISWPDEPFYVISGGGAKRPRPLSDTGRGEPPLIYGNSTLGFAAIVAEPKTLKVLMIDALGGEVGKVELLKGPRWESYRFEGQFQVLSLGAGQPDGSMPARSPEPAGQVLSQRVGP